MGKSSLATMYIPAYTGNYGKGRNGNKIEMITIHHMAGVMSAKSCGALWKKVGRRGSSNYGIGKDGEIACYVDENDTSWCNSNLTSIRKSVTIETSNSSTGGDWPVSDTVLNALIKLVADIAKRNGLGTLVKGQNVTWHSMYTATTCPGPYLLSKMDYIVSEANKINGASTESSTNNSTSTSNGIPAGFFPSRGYFKRGDVSPNVGKIAKFMRNVFPAYTSSKALGNIYGPYIESAIKEFQRRAKADGKYNDNVDGFCGPITVQSLMKYGFEI